MTTPAPQAMGVPDPRDRGPVGGHDRAAREAPGWLTLVEALDQFAAGLVARFEHELTHASAERAAELRHQLAQAYRLEAITSAEVETARHTPAVIAVSAPPEASLVYGDPS